jgi:hypothetical protein
VLLSVIVICAASIIFTTIVLSRQVVSSLAPASEAEFVASGRNDARFTVHYIENGLFGGGARPARTLYLMSFTDYIVFENSFTAQFKQEAVVSYRYSVTETLTVRPLRSSDRNSGFPVYEEIFTLSEMIGSVIGEHIFFDGSGSANEPGGVFVIDPKKYINLYTQFTEAHQLQMQNQDMTERPPGFTANLLVEFSYHIRAEETGVNQTLIRGFNIPLLSEVVEGSETGASAFELSLPPGEPERLGLSTAILWFLWFTAHIAVICYCLRQLTMEKDVYRREVMHILKKYSDEITVLAEPVDLSGYKVISVIQFQELVKLAVNLNKHIFCVLSKENVKFYTIADGYAYCFFRDKIKNT